MLTYSPTTARTTYSAQIIRSISQKICCFGLLSPIYQDLNHFKRSMNNTGDVSSTRSSRCCYSGGSTCPAAQCSSRQGSYALGGQCHSARKQDHSDQCSSKATSQCSGGKRHRSYIHHSHNYCGSTTRLVGAVIAAVRCTERWSFQPDWH